MEALVQNAIQMTHGHSKASPWAIEQEIHANSIPPVDHDMGKTKCMRTFDTCSTACCVNYFRVRTRYTQYM